LTPEVFFTDFDERGRPAYAHASVFAARRIHATDDHDEPSRDTLVA
jgi:hypothetical protein